ncbi:hypothetical protein [aff. Roholtiella sp. LEGE 12411]|uniref:hypothetical protein n=1 Tax=aff. Roholtiella sp. LEGE 12411 TaxID=1828822 RepID=UPI00187DDE76|nr:hypothetical protein [aff. Roholtiella sp. LEGE 12411]MBE9038601.1 hypothetical protein [aff. Roholtiella sp. LEGE 12411]
MTNTPEQPSRLDRIEGILERVADQQADLSIRQSNTQAQLDELSQEMRGLTSNVDRVLARSAILDNVLLELRESSEQHQQNFEEHQRTTNAALQSLEAILLQLIRIFPQN